MTVKGFWVLMPGAVLVMLALTPLVIRLRIPSWTVGWLAILLGTVGVRALLSLVERLTVSMADGRSSTTGNPDRARYFGKSLLYQLVQVLI